MIKKTKKERILSSLSLASMILMFALLLFLLFFAMYKMGALSLPQSVIDFFGLDKGEVSSDTPGDDGSIYDFLLDALQSGDLEPIEYNINSIDAKKVLSESSSVSEYTAKLTVTLSSGGETRVLNLDVWKSGEKYRIETKEGGSLTQTLICDGEQILIKDHVTFQTVQEKYYPRSDIFSFESEAMIPDVSEIFSNNELSDLSVSLLRSNRETVYLIEYKLTEPEYTERLYVSVEFGLVLRAESISEKEKFYSLDTSFLSRGLVNPSVSEEQLFLTKQ